LVRWRAAESGLFFDKLSLYRFAYKLFYTGDGTFNGIFKAFFSFLPLLASNFLTSF